MNWKKSREHAYEIAYHYAKAVALMRVDYQLDKQRMFPRIDKMVEIKRFINNHTRHAEFWLETYNACAVGLDKLTFKMLVDEYLENNRLDFSKNSD